MVAQAGQLDAAPNFGLALASRRGLFFGRKPLYLGDAAKAAGGNTMDKAKQLTEAIQLVVKARKQTTDITAIWCKVDRVARYLNEQLAAELA